MSKEDKILELTEYQKLTRDHFIFLLIILVSFVLSDLSYRLIELLFEDILTSVQNKFLGDFTFPLITSMLMMSFARLFSEILPEVNLNETPSLLDFIASILILTHPLRVYQSAEGFKIRFDIFAMFKNGEIIIFILSFLFYLFAVFSIQQILLVQDKRESTKIAYYLDLLYSDILPILATLFALIYVGLSILESSLERIDLSMMVKMILFILFSVAALPSVNTSNEKGHSVQV